MHYFLTNNKYDKMMLGAAKYVNQGALFRKLVHKSKGLFVKMFNIS